MPKHTCPWMGWFTHLMAVCILMLSHHQDLPAQAVPPSSLEAAIEQAKKQDRPILIWLSARWSGGSSAMRSQTLSDPAVRDALDKQVVFLEVDRDEQPELDAGLQAAFASINGRAGGYPLTVFCTADGDPFEALGFVPAATTENGLGLPDIINRVGALWRDDRSRVLQYASVIREQVLVPPDNTGSSPELNGETALRIARASASLVTTGGLVLVGTTPVPLPTVAIMLAAVGQKLEDKSVADASDRLLNGVLRSPLRDHIQGGYFRFVAWDGDRPRAQPEKLLSVQAAWLRAFAAGHMQSQRSRHVEACQEILRFTRSQMDIPEGGWRAYLSGMSQVANNENPWLWSGADIRGIAEMPAKDGEVLIRYLGLSESDRRVPVPVSLLEPVAKGLGMSYDAANQALMRGRALAAKSRQSEPGYPRASHLRILQWEGAAITAYILAAEVTGDKTVQEHALKTARSIASRDVGPDGTIPRMVLDGKPVVDGTYADYAQVSEALLNAHIVSSDPALLDAARRVLMRGESLREEGQTSGTPSLLLGGRRLLYSQDGDLPSPLSVAGAAWMVLDSLEPGKGYRDRGMERIREILRENRRGNRGESRPAEAGAGWTLIAMLASAAGQ